MKTTAYFILLLFSLQGLAQSPGGTPPSARDLRTGNLTDEQKSIMDNYTHQEYQKEQYEKNMKEACESKDFDELQCQNILNGGKATQGKKNDFGLGSSEMQAVAQIYSMIVGSADFAGKLKTREFDKKNLKSDEQLAEMDAEDAKKFRDDPKNVTRSEYTSAKKTMEANKPTKGPDGENVFKSPEQEKAYNDSKSTVEKGEEQGTKEGEKEDYCKWVAVGTEVIAMAKQTTDNDFILAEEAGTEDAQISALRKQKRSHKSRKEGAGLQVSGWGATTVCYTAMLASPTVAKDSAGLWLKLGGAAVLTKHFAWEKEQHEDAMDVVQGLIEKLGDKSDNCNPISQRDCYCSMPTTMNDTTYCMPQIRKRMSAKNMYQVTCLDKSLKPDPDCECAVTNDCADKTIKEGLASFRIPGFASNELNPFYQMTKGNANVATSQRSFDSQTKKLFATVAKAFREKDGKKAFKDMNLKLNKEQTLEAKEMMKMGLPKTLAAALSKTKASEEAKKNVAKLNPGFKKRFYFGGKKYNYARNKKAKYGNSSGLSKKKSRASNSYGNFMNKFKKKKSRRNNENGDVLKFSDIAERNAGITNNKNAGLFKIISRRYQLVSKRRLEIE